MLLMNRAVDCGREKVKALHLHIFSVKFISWLKLTAAHETTWVKTAQSVAASADTVGCGCVACVDIVDRWRHCNSQPIRRRRRFFSVFFWPRNDATSWTRETKITQDRFNKWFQLGLSIKNLHLNELKTKWKWRQIESDLIYWRILFLTFSGSRKIFNCFLFSFSFSVCIVSYHRRRFTCFCQQQKHNRCRKLGFHPTFLSCFSTRGVKNRGPTEWVALNRND
jgi:hypothetical protein